MSRDAAPHVVSGEGFQQVGECKDLISARCLARIGRWRVPANYERQEWMREVEAVVACTALVAEREYDASRGVPRDAFVFDRILGTVLTRYRQEWRFATRHQGAVGRRPARDSLPLSNPTRPNVAQAVACLPKADRDLIASLFWEGRTEAEVGAQLAVTQQTISKRKASILKRLRNAFILYQPAQEQ